MREREREKYLFKKFHLEKCESSNLLIPWKNMIKKKGKEKGERIEGNVVF